MKYIKSLSVFALAGLVAFTACTKSREYEPAAPESGAKVYFYNTNETSVKLDRSATSYDIVLGRASADEALTVPVKVSGNEGDLLTIPTSVSFAAGQSEANLTIGYDLEKVGYDNEVKFTVALGDESFVSAYGISSLSVSAVIPSPWTSLGTGTIVENWWPMGTCSVEIQQNDVDPTIFKIIGPFGSKETPTLKLLKPGDKLAGTSVTQDDLVYYDPIYIVYYGSYDSDIYLNHISDGFKGGDDESSWVHSRVIEYQESGLPGLVQLAGFYYMDGIGGWNQSATDGAFLIYFPGYAPKDFTFLMNREGIFYDLEENPYAVANITIESEESDIAYISAACVKTKDEEAALEALLAGEADAVTVNEGGSVKLPMDGESGDYTIIAIAFDENGEPQEYMATSFEYYAPGSSNPWESIGFCKYTDDIIAPMFEADPVTYYVEVLANSEVPGMYRMVHPYGADYPYNDEGDYDTAVHYFEIDATDPSCVWFDEINLGVDWSYGTMYAMSMYAYTLATGGSEEEAAAYAGKLEDGKITFPAESIIMADDDGAYKTNPNGLFCLDINNPLPERPEEEGEAAVAAAPSYRVSMLKTVEKRHSRRIGIKLDKSGFETLSK